MTMPPTSIGMKVMASVAAGVAGFMTVGSYKAYSGTWQNDADIKDRDISMRSRLYREELVHTGNSYIPSLIHYFNRPDMFFFHKIRRAYTYTKGFVRDVLWGNVVPLGLGTMAVAWGFNLNLAKMASGSGRFVGKGLRVLGTALGSSFKALRSVFPRVNAKALINFFKPTTPRGVLTLASTAALGLVMLPYMVLDAARGDKSSRMLESFLHRHD
jgi:hypothetical protein